MHDWVLTVGTPNVDSVTGMFTLRLVRARVAKVTSVTVLFDACKMIVTETRSCRGDGDVEQLERVAKLQ